MPDQADFETYQSPYSWRYGTPEMRAIWSESHKRRLWRQLWLALAETQAGFGLVGEEQVSDLRAHVGEINVARSLEIEAEIHHDLMAELKAYAEQCPLGGKVLHLGATSMDIEDNADVLRLRESLNLVLKNLDRMLMALAEKILAWADLPIMAFTHLQPAEPSTLGYRLAQYAQDGLSDREVLLAVQGNLRGKGFKGAVGTSASYADLLGAGRLAEFERQMSQRLHLEFYPVATQTYPRKQDYRIVSALAGLAGTVYKFAFDLRFLQSPPIGEWSEPFGARQVGSSAMPFKRNPVNAEKIDSLARYLAQLPRVAWDNAAHSLLERTLDDSANRRITLPEAFLCADELLRTAIRIVEGLQIDEAAQARNLAVYGPFAATERVLMALGKAGADRQAMHERLREHAMLAWETIRQGQPNPLPGRICQDDIFQVYLPEEELSALMDAGHYVGDAPQRARILAETIRKSIGLLIETGAAG